MISLKELTTKSNIIVIDVTFNEPILEHYMEIYEWAGSTRVIPRPHKKPV